MLNKRALVVSPFATVPLDAGQRKRAHQTTKLLRELGYDLTFFLYAFEDGWKTQANEDWLKEMRQDWGEVILLRANPNVGLPARGGWTHGLDEWWDEVLETHLKEILAYRFFDVMVVHNVWLSKAFDIAPRCTLKILDSHDVFSERLPYFERTNTKPEFFITSSQSEAHGVSRANIVLGIQQNDADWFARNTQAISLCLPYAPEASAMAASRTDYLHQDKVVFGFLGSNHIFNRRGLKHYTDELARAVGRSCAPVELLIAGTICESIEREGPWKCLGPVPDEDEFLRQVDVIVAPVFDGSGFKVKMADASSRGIPTIAASHAAIGMHFDGGMLADDPKDLAKMTVNIALRRPDYRQLAKTVRAAHEDLKEREAVGKLRLSGKIAGWQNTVVYDATGLTLEEAHCVLLGWSGAFHLMRNIARQLVVAPEGLDHLKNVVPPGVVFVSESEIAEHAQKVWCWITVRNVGPAKWGAKAHQIWPQDEWNAVLEHDSDGFVSDSDESRPYAFFWHNLTWDVAVQRIIAWASRLQQNRRAQGLGVTDLRDEVLVMDERHRAGLGRTIESLFAEFTVASIDSFEEFSRLLLAVVAGRLRRLVVTQTAHRSRIRMLRELCGIRGIEFVGPGEQGSFCAGRAGDSQVGRGYELFERQWRLEKRMFQRRPADFEERSDPESAPPASALRVVSPAITDGFVLSAAEKMLPKNNMHFLEYGANGAPFRWTGPDNTCRFSLLLDRSAPLELEIAFLDFHDVERQTPLVVMVDDIAVDHRMARSATGEYTVTATVPENAHVGGGLTDICFVLRQVLRASAGDERLIGAAFTRLSVSKPKAPDAEANRDSDEGDGAKAVQSAPDSPPAAGPDVQSAMGIELTAGPEVSPGEP